MAATMHSCYPGKAFGLHRSRANVTTLRHRAVDVRCLASHNANVRPAVARTSDVVDRRRVLLTMLAGSMLLPARPSMSEEDPSVVEVPVTEPAVSEAAVTEIPTEIPAETPSDASPADEVPAAEPAEVAATSSTDVESEPPAVAATGPTKVFMDVTINGEPAGRLVFELLPDVPAGATRFAQLAAGRQGVDYRLSKFNGVLPTYIRNDGLSRLSYSATEVSPIAFGDSVEELEAELDRQTRRHDEAGLVSLVVREREARPVKERLVARDGKLITVLEQAGEAPNGTQFTVTTAPSPELDSTNLIIGRLVEGAALLKRISSLPVNRPRNDNPYFQAGKAMGDKRAVTAERAFYRPFQKVVVSGSGLEP